MRGSTARRAEPAKKPADGYAGPSSAEPVTSRPCGSITARLDVAVLCGGGILLASARASARSSAIPSNPGDWAGRPSIRTARAITRSSTGLRRARQARHLPRREAVDRPTHQVSSPMPGEIPRHRCPLRCRRLPATLQIGDPNQTVSVGHRYSCNLRPQCGVLNQGGRLGWNCVAPIGRLDVEATVEAVAPSSYRRQVHEGRTVRRRRAPSPRPSRESRRQIASWAPRKAHHLRHPALRRPRPVLIPPTVDPARRRHR